MSLVIVMIALSRHIRIHLGIKPYKCNFCVMTFSDKVRG